jgi:hypothetical protein
MIKPNQANPESYNPKKPEILRLAEEMYINNSFPQKLILDDVPKIGWGQINGRAPTDYSLPGCLGNIICYIDETDKQKSIDINNADKIGFVQHKATTIDNSTLDKANQTLMNVTGISYGTLWLDYDGQGFDTMINVLARVNHFADMIDHSMKYYGRDYLYIEDDSHNNYYDDIIKAIIVSINKGYPVLAENICGIPEFSIITGYDDYGDKLIGWAYCSECANNFLENGMFVGNINKNIPNNKPGNNP